MPRQRPPRLDAELLARLAEGFILSSRKGRPYLKRYAAPKNPRTPGQRAARGAFARAVHAWQAADPVAKARWNEQARNQPGSGYNLFIRDFMARDGSVPD
jgi:hypothetical protein